MHVWPVPPVEMYCCKLQASLRKLVIVALINKLYIHGLVMSWVVLDTFSYCKSCCKLKRTTDIELKKQGESENIIIIFHKRDWNSHADFALMRRAVETAILAVVDNKTAKTTHYMCVAATVSVSLGAVCSWIATCNCRTSRSSKSTRINSPTSSPTTPVCRTKPSVTACDAEKRRSPV